MDYFYVTDLLSLITLLYTLHIISTETKGNTVLAQLPLKIHRNLLHILSTSVDEHKTITTDFQSGDVVPGHTLNKINLIPASTSLLDTNQIGRVPYRYDKAARTMSSGINVSIEL